MFDLVQCISGFRSLPRFFVDDSAAMRLAPTIISVFSRRPKEARCNGRSTVTFQ